jgi:hypothetical protein
MTRHFDFLSVGEEFGADACLWRTQRRVKSADIFERQEEPISGKPAARRTSVAGY